MEYFSHRATVRRYTDEPISDNELMKMLEAAVHAPTNGGMQLYNIVVTRSKEGKEALAPAHFNQPCLMQAQAVLTFCADLNRVTRWAEERGAQPGFDNLQSFISAMLDASIVAQQFVTIAELSGLGTCYLGTTAWNADQIIGTLNLPRLVVPVITVTVGVPQEKTYAQPRLPMEAVVSRESYRSADIDRAYGELEGSDDSLRYMAENGKPTLAHVFTDVRYPRSANEHFSQLLLKVLKDQGFM